MMGAAVPSIRRVLFSLLIVGGSVYGAAQALTQDEIQQVLRDAKAKAVTVPGQVGALIALAWPTEEDPNFQIQAEARRSLVLYGQHVLPVLRRTIPLLDPLYQADAVAAFVEARYREPAGMPPDYLPGLEDSIWYGSSEAQRIALNEIQRYNYPPAVLSSIDGAYDNPILTRYVVASLGRMNDPRAQMFLTDLLLEGSDFYKGPAALALAQFGDRTFDNFRSGVASDDSTTRQTALRIFLPLAETSDLELLKAYLAQRTEDDPELVEAVRKRVNVLQRRQDP